MTPWWERFKPIYERELRDLEKYGIEYEHDDEAFSQGKLVLRVRLEVDGELHDGELLYPDTYPYFRVRLNVPGLQKARHYNPLNGNLCLLERGSRNWDPDWTAGYHITNTLSKWEKASGSKDRAKVANLEDHQAEPEAAYFSSVVGSVVVIDNTYDIPEDLNSGLLELGFLSNGTPQTAISSGQVRAVLLRIMNNNKGEVARMAEPMFSYYSSISKSTQVAYWTRFDEPPYGIETGALTFLEEKTPAIHEKIRGRLSSGRECILGITFPQESDYSGGRQNGWLFIVAFKKEQSRG